MLEHIDIKVVGIIGIVIILVIGYFVYLMYQDLVFLKKEVVEIKTAPSQNFTEDESGDLNDWDSNVVDNTGLSDREQDIELERHLASFMDSEREVGAAHMHHHMMLQSQQENHTVPDIVEITHDEQEIVVQEEKPKKPRGRKKKVAQTAEPMPAISEEQTPDLVMEHVEV